MSRELRLPWAVLFRRLGAMIFSLLASLAATELFIRYANTDGMSAVDDFRCALIAISTAWLAWGASLVLFGLTYVAEPIARIAEPAQSSPNITFSSAFRCGKTE